MECRQRLEDYLTSENVPFEEVHHLVAYTAQDVAAVEHVSGKLVAKVVVVMSNGRPLMLVVPASRRIDLDKARRSLNAPDLRLASEQEFAGLFADCEVGAMPPFGNLFGLPVFVDRSLTADPLIIVQAGTHTDTIELRYSDFQRLVNPEIRDLTYGQ